MTAYSASVDVPVSRLDEDRFIADPNQMKPDVCGGIVLTNIVVASGGGALGTNQNDLILGTGSADVLVGRDGDDCIVAGAAGSTLLGNVLWGGNGNDVLVGHPSSFDTCIWDGNDAFYDCDLFLVFPVFP